MVTISGALLLAVLLILTTASFCLPVPRYLRVLCVAHLVIFAYLVHSYAVS